MCIQREVIEAAGEEALALGLLSGIEDPGPHEAETAIYCFLHLMFQEFSAGKYISKLPKVGNIKLFMVHISYHIALNWTRIIYIINKCSKRENLYTFFWANW